ncbi:MAG: hypothetical protein LBS57_03640 [Treponema sp.]|jgi:hypothetical protein|nr:hypothetical protein [Treponema sp.]
MAQKALFPALVFGALFILPLPAATVSFLVIETGLSEEVGASQHSGLWESGLLDVFFEAGHIVSNAPILRLSKGTAKIFPDEALESLREAVEGGMDFFIIALLDYTAPNDTVIQKPEKISLRLFNAASQKLIYEQQYTDKTSKNPGEEFASLKQAARGLVPHLNDR